MRKIIRKIVLGVNILLAILLIISVLSVYFSPARYWVFPFLGIAFPFLFILNLLFILFWSFLGKWYLLISLFCVLSGSNQVKKFIKLSSKKSELVNSAGSFKLLTYNVRLFNYYQWLKDTSYRNKIIEYIRQENPDILCFQEFIALPYGKLSLSNLKSDLAQLPYVQENYTYIAPRKINFGLVTFSRFPIINHGVIDFKGSLNGVIYVDMIINKDTIRVYNCHLQSIKLEKDYSNLLDSLIFNYSDKQLNEIKYISARMRTAFIKRSHQVDILSGQIKSSPYPVIICGDFNDTPISYTYHKLSLNMKDAFIESGSGLGNTYRGNLSYVRIDYILSSPKLQSFNYRRDKVAYSDHYPVWCNFVMNQKADSLNQHSHR